MITDRPVSLALAEPDLRAFDGATIEWYSLVLTHGELVLTVCGLPRGTGQLWLLGTSYVDLPVRVHNVRLRLADTAEADSLRGRLTPQLAGRFRPEELLVIECDEGDYAVWARRIAVRWVDPAEFLQSVWGDLAGPLWPGGPPFGEL